MHGNRSKSYAQDDDDDDDNDDDDDYNDDENLKWLGTVQVLRKPFFTNSWLPPSPVSQSKQLADYITFPML